MSTSTRSDLLYNKKPVYQSDILNSYTDYLLPRHIHDDNTQCVIELPATAFSLPFDECFFSVKYKIQKKSDTNTWVEVEHTKGGGDGPDVSLAPINNILESLFQSYDISIQGKIISENNGIYPHLAHIIKLINYSKSAKDTYLALSGWHTNTGDPDITNAANKGWVARKNRILNGREDVVTGILYSDLAYSLAQIPSNTEITLILQKTKPEFFLIGGADDTTYRIKINEVQLETKRYEIAPRLNNEIERQLSSIASIPFTHLSANNYYIPVGTSCFQVPRLILGQVPLRLIFGIVENDAFTGIKSKTPFNYKLHNLTSLQISIDGKVIPARPLETSNYIEPYKLLFRNTGQFCTNVTCDVSFDDFKTGSCLYVLNLRSDGEVRSDIYPSRTKGTVSLKMNFSGTTGTVKGLTVISIAEYENVYLVDRLRNISSDHTTH